MNQETENTGVRLAAILTDYLASNRADAPSSGRVITATTNMVTELQLDSFQVMEFMLEVEDQFDVAIDLESLANIQTIEDLSKVVQDAQGSG